MRTKGSRLLPRSGLTFALSGCDGSKAEARSQITPSLVLALLLAAALAAGCSKHQPAAGANPATNALQADASADAAAAPPSPRGPGPMAAPARAAVIPDSGDVNATLGQLSLELRKYVVRTRSVPKNFEEFLAKSHVQAPPAPPGKKYAIQDQAVVLVKL
jgi:hypothetical protein